MDARIRENLHLIQFQMHLHYNAAALPVKLSCDRMFRLRFFLGLNFGGEAG